MRKRMLACMLCFGLVLAGGCQTAGNETTVDTSETETAEEQSLTTEEPEVLEEGYEEVYLSQPLPEENFSWSLFYDSVRNDQVFTIQNISEQDYNYVDVDILFYNEENQLIDYASDIWIYRFLAGSEQMIRFVPSLYTAAEYDHLELLFSGEVMAEEKELNPLLVQILEESRLADGRILIKCVNDTGADIYSVTFRIDYYKNGEKIASESTEDSMIAEGREFIVTFSQPCDGWYNELPQDAFDSWEIRVERAAAL